MRKKRINWFFTIARFSAVMCAVVLLAACSRQDETVRFIVMGDSRGSFGGGAVNEEILTEMANAVLHEDVDFVLFTGDLVWGGASEGTLQEQIATWIEIMQPVYDAGIGVYPIRGNHEMLQDTAAGDAWKSVFVGQYAVPDNGSGDEKGLTYSFSYKNVFVAGLDEYANEHRVNQQWLDAQLTANDQPHVFVFGHEPAFKALHPDCLDDYPAQRDAFWENIMEAGGRIYFTGHDHFYDHTRLDDGDGRSGNDLHQIIAGGSGADLYDEPVYDGDNSRWIPMPVYHEKEFGYVLVEVTGKRVRSIWKHRTGPDTYEPGGDDFTYWAR